MRTNPQVPQHPKPLCAPTIHNDIPQARETPRLDFNQQDKIVIIMQMLMMMMVMMMMMMMTMLMLLMMMMVVVMMMMMVMMMVAMVTVTAMVIVTMAVKQKKVAPTVRNAKLTPEAQLQSF